MSESDVNKAQQRLERAKKELQWLLKMLNNPAIFLQGYDLDPAEKERLLNEYIAGILELLFPYADALTKQTGSWEEASSSPAEAPAYTQSGRYRFIEVSRPGDVPLIRIVGPGGPVYWPQDPPWPEPEPEPGPDTDNM